MTQEIIKQAITERGKTLTYQEDEVDLALKLLVLNGGSIKPTIEQLVDEGFKISPHTLSTWRKTSFPRKYAEVRHQLGKAVSEEVAGRALERALQADEAQSLYLDEAIAKVGEVDPNHLAKSVAAIAQAKGNEIEKARLLRNEPDSITETRTLDENVSALERFKVLVPEEIDGEATEE